MRKFYFFIFTLCAFSAQSQIINFPDANFKAKLLSATTTNHVAENADQQSMVIDANADGEIQVSEAVAIYYLSVYNSSISNLSGIENFTSLKLLQCEDNQITTFSSAGLGNLTDLYASSNSLTSIDLSGFSGSLRWLSITGNQLTEINLTPNLTGLEMLDFGANPITSIDVTPVASSLKTLGCINAQLTSLDTSSLTQLNMLGCNGNPMTSLILSPSIKTLNCRDSQLTALDLTGMANLEVLICGNNQISYLDLTQSPNLNTLSCFKNPLGNLDLSHFPLLEILVCSTIGATEFDFSANPLLEWVTCGINDLSSLDVSMLPELNNFDCRATQITSLDLSDNGKLASFVCKDNPNLTSIFLKNGIVEGLDFSGCPALEYICGDSAQLADIDSKITTYGYTNCTANNYCTFVPGGTFYTVQGQFRYNTAGAGCDAADPTVGGMKLKVVKGTTTEIYIGDASGSYNIPLQAGLHTLTPILENSNYATISPASTSVNFPLNASPATRNFCIQPFVAHPDLAIEIIPLTGTRPGFPLKFEIVCSNYGNVSQSGTVTLQFQNDVVQFVSSPSSTLDGNTITWTFGNLLPLHTKSFYVHFLLNSPASTPPLTGGENLIFTGNVVSTSTLNEDTPNDNTHELTLTTVNSLDPNDKTCLEGNIVGPEIIGEYVHYVIRFENTGTANAVNVVVKDMIDTNKFDVETLIPITASHPFTTRITETNKVEFIFESINLPFDDANNDGYVAFKIKTKPSLVVGDTFSNSASIYFDYNSPIITNTATTVIQLLGNPDFEFSDAFTLYPNPARNILNIQSKNGMEVNSISIYNLLGQLIRTETGNVSAIDISKLQTGHYFLKVHSDKGSAVTKFIKQ